MALINGIYIHVIDEDTKTETEASEHSVENGSNITDHIKVKPAVVSLSGKAVNYTAYSSETKTEQKTINAWLSLVKRDGSAFDTMSFDRLSNELLTFYGGADWHDSGDVRYLDENGNVVNCSTAASTGIYAVRFELVMPYASTVRIQNAVKDYCCFNIINKSTTSYNVRDYDADSEATNDFVLSNTYKGQTGRIRTEFTNYDTETSTTNFSEEKSAAWVLDCLKSWLKSGALVTYEGRNYLTNYQIRSLNTSHPNEVTGGAKFDMELREFKGATNSYTAANGAVANGGVQQISQGDNSEVWYEVQLGDSLYNLISQYSNLKRDLAGGTAYTTIDWIMEKNPRAFDNPSDCTTLKAYEKILMGYR